MLERRLENSVSTGTGDCGLGFWSADFLILSPRPEVGWGRHTVSRAPLGPFRCRRLGGRVGTDRDGGVSGSAWRSAHQRPRGPGRATHRTATRPGWPRPRRPETTELRSCRQRAGRRLLGGSTSMLWGQKHLCSRSVSLSFTPSLPPSPWTHTLPLACSLGTECERVFVWYVCVRVSPWLSVDGNETKPTPSPPCTRPKTLTLTPP